MFSLPTNRAEAISIMAAGLGSLSHAIQLANNSGLPGVTRTGALTSPRIGTAQKTAPKAGPIGQLVLVVTAAEILREAQQQNQEKQIIAIVSRFNLDREKVADLLAAEAYLWIQNYGPWVFFRLPNEQSKLDKVGQALMNYERTHPTTLRRSGRGDRQAVGEVRQVVDEALMSLGLAINDAAIYRTSSVNPALSADSSRCRALLGLTSQDWRAHHIIPFAVVADLPPPVQLAFVKSGWAMDQIENLIALPANLSFYSILPSPKGPVHNSAHIRYSRDVENALKPTAAKALTIGSLTLLSDLRLIQRTFKIRLLNSLSGYHPILP